MIVDIFNRRQLIKTPPCPRQHIRSCKKTLQWKKMSMSFSLLLYKSLTFAYALTHTQTRTQALPYAQACTHPYTHLHAHTHTHTLAQEHTHFCKLQAHALFLLFVVSLSHRPTCRDIMIPTESWGDRWDFGNWTTRGSIVLTPKTCMIVSAN